MAVIRARDTILRARTLLVNSVRGIAKGFGVRRRVGQQPEFARLESRPLMKATSAAQDYVRNSRGAMHCC